MKVAYLGPERTNTESAARELASRISSSYELVPCVAMPGVVQSLFAEAPVASDFGVMPYYNYLEGFVQQTLDLIYDHNLFIHDVFRMPIVHCLGAHPDNTRTDLIYSISVALGQCTEYLSAHHPDARQVAVSSTAEGASTLR